MLIDIFDTPLPVPPNLPTSLVCAYTDDHAAILRMHSESPLANPGIHTNPEVAGSSPVGAQTVPTHPNCQLQGTRPKRREYLPPLASLPKAKRAHRATGAISSLAELPVRSQCRFEPNRAAPIQREYLTRRYQPSSLCSCRKCIPRRHTLQPYFTHSCAISLT